MNCHLKTQAFGACPTKQAVKRATDLLRQQRSQFIHPSFRGLQKEIPAGKGSIKGFQHAEWYPHGRVVPLIAGVNELQYRLNCYKYGEAEG